MDETKPGIPKMSVLPTPPEPEGFGLQHPRGTRSARQIGIAGRYKACNLTRRELDVPRLLAEGLTNLQIAEHLFVSPYTVHAHLNSIYSKLATASWT